MFCCLFCLNMLTILKPNPFEIKAAGCAVKAISSLSIPGLRISPEIVNIYFDFYYLSDFSMARKFYVTLLEVFKSLLWFVSIPWQWFLQWAPSWNFWLQFSKISAPTFSVLLFLFCSAKKKKLNCSENCTFSAIN